MFGPSGSGKSRNLIGDTQGVVQRSLNELLMALKESKENQLRGWENNNTTQSYNEDIIQPPYFESKRLE